MATIKGVKVIDNTNTISKNVTKNLFSAMVDVVNDVERVSSESAPHLTGKLEKNRKSISGKGTGIEGTVSFHAVNRGFNYDKWTHDARYNLGEKSARKPGGRSGIGKGGTIPVGTGYLSNTLMRNEKGYLNYLDDAYKKALK